MENVTPEVAEAVNIIEQACASVNGNLETHQQIQNAIVVVKNALEGNAAKLLKKKELKE